MRWTFIRLKKSIESLTRFTWVWSCLRGGEALVEVLGISVGLTGEQLAFVRAGCRLPLRVTAGAISEPSGCGAWQNLT